jgi:hypothetical protein
MKKLLITFVAALLISFWAGVTFAQSRLPGVWTFPDKVVEDQLIVQLGTWYQACKAMKMETACRDLIPPRVAYGLLPSQYGAYDLGSRTILVDMRIMFQEVAVGVMFHEMIHFLQGKRDPLRANVVTKAQACLDEKEAHDLARKFADEFKIEDKRIRPWDEAAITYSCDVNGNLLTLLP